MIGHRFWTSGLVAHILNLRGGKLPNTGRPDTLITLALPVKKLCHVRKPRIAVPKYVRNSSCRAALPVSAPGRKDASHRHSQVPNLLVYFCTILLSNHTNQYSCNPFLNWGVAWLDVLLWKSRNRDIQPNDMYKLPKVHEINSVARNFYKVCAKLSSSAC